MSKKVTRTCKRCGKTFETYPSEVKAGKALYCSKECFYTHDPAKWVETNCAACGKAITVARSQHKLRKNNFCSPGCVGDWTHTHQRGKNHPAWRGGKTAYSYPREYHAKKGLIKSRDSWECRVCQSAGPLLVHHIDEDPLNNDDGNLVTVCHKCHRGPIHARNEITFVYDGHIHQVIKR